MVLCASCVASTSGCSEGLEVRDRGRLESGLYLHSEEREVVEDEVSEPVQSVESLMLVVVVAHLPVALVAPDQALESPVSEELVPPPAR